MTFQTQLLILNAANFGLLAGAFTCPGTGHSFVLVALVWFLASGFLLFLMKKESQ